MIYVHFWKEKSRIYGVLIGPNLYFMLQSPSGAASWRGEAEKSSTLSLLALFLLLLLLSLTYQPTLSHFVLVWKHTSAGAPNKHTHQLQHTHTQVKWDLFSPSATPSLLSHQFSHTFLFSASSSSHRCLALHLRPQPPPHIDLFLFIVNAVVPMATSQLLIANVTIIRGVCVCVFYSVMNHSVVRWPVAL